MKKTKIKYVFDVDGTLTPSRKRMNKHFAVWFSKFCEKNDVYLVTGSDRPKTIEQVGDYVYHTCKLVYNCSGNDVYHRDQNMRRNEWKLPDLARTFLISCEYESQFELRTGNHIEERPGMVNFSVVGRNANAKERKAYVDFERNNNERRKIADAFNMMFPDLRANVGGETGLDIGPKGADKSQIMVDFEDCEVHFFGDAMDEGGNDYPLKIANKYGKNFAVKDWKDTWDKLKKLGE